MSPVPLLFGKDDSGQLIASVPSSFKIILSVFIEKSQDYWSQVEFNFLQREMKTTAPSPDLRSDRLSGSF